MLQPALTRSPVLSSSVHFLLIPTLQATKDSSTGPGGSSGTGASSGQPNSSGQTSSGYENKDPLHVDETLSRIQSQKGVLGVLVTNHEGLVMRSNLDNVQTTQLASLSSQLSTLARHAVRDLDPEVGGY